MLFDWTGDSARLAVTGPGVGGFVKTYFTGEIVGAAVNLDKGTVIGPEDVVGFSAEADVGTTRTGVANGTDVGPALGPTGVVGGADGSWAVGDIEGVVSCSNVLGFPHKVAG